MKRVYTRDFIQDNKKAFVPMGWVCPKCGSFKLDGATGT